MDGDASEFNTLFTQFHKNTRKYSIPCHFKIRRIRWTVYDTNWFWDPYCLTGPTSPPTLKNGPPLKKKFLTFQKFRLFKTKKVLDKSLIKKFGSESLKVWQALPPRFWWPPKIGFLDVLDDFKEKNYKEKFFWLRNIYIIYIFSLRGLDTSPGARFWGLKLAFTLKKRFGRFVIWYSENSSGLW